MAMKIDAPNTQVNTYNQDTQYDIESLIESKYKKEKKEYLGAYGNVTFAYHHPEQTSLRAGHRQQQNTPSSTGKSGEAFSHLKRTALFCLSGSVSKLKGTLPAGGNATSEVKNDDGQSGVHFSAEGQAGTATGSDKRELTAGQVQLKSSEDKQQLQSGETAPVLEQQSWTQEAKAAEAEQPTSQTTTYMSDAVQVKDTDSFNIEYRFSRWQGDHCVTLTTTVGTGQPDALLMYPSSQRVMETLNAHTGDWNGDKSLIVQISDEDASQNHSGRQQQNDEDEA